VCVLAAAAAAAAAAHALLKTGTWAVTHAEPQTHKTRAQP
jgi:hypothetical protein